MQAQRGEARRASPRDVRVARMETRLSARRARRSDAGATRRGEARREVRPRLDARGAPAPRRERCARASTREVRPRLDALLRETCAATLRETSPRHAASAAREAHRRTRAPRHAASAGRAPRTAGHEPLATPRPPHARRTAGHEPLATPRRRTAPRPAGDEPSPCRVRRTCAAHRAPPETRPSPRRVRRTRGTTAAIRRDPCAALLARATRPPCLRHGSAALRETSPAPGRVRRAYGAPVRFSIHAPRILPRSPRVRRPDALLHPRAPHLAAFAARTAPDVLLDPRTSGAVPVRRRGTTPPRFERATLRRTDSANCVRPPA